MKASLKVKNWSYKVIEYMKSNKIDLYDIDSEINYLSVKNFLFDRLSDIALQHWLSDVNKLESKRGLGENKLRTYRKFKQDFLPEMYVTMNIKKKYRRALALFRAGIAPINIELKKYSSLYIPVHERKCIICDEVESECHVLLNCPLYADIREDLFVSVIIILPPFTSI